MAERRVASATLTIGGAPLAADVQACLSMVRVEESVHLPDLLVTRFDDPHFQLLDRGVFRLGDVVEVSIQTEGRPVVVTEVEVTSIAVEALPGRRTELVVTGMDRWHRLARVPRHRTFASMSDASIARQIASEYGLEADVSASAGAPPTQVVQSGLSDAAFLRTRAARSGFDAWVSGRTLHFAPRPTSSATAPKVVWGENLHSLRVRYSAVDRFDEAVVSGWDAAAKKVVTGRASDCPPTTDAPFLDAMAGDAMRAFGNEKRTTGRRGTANQDEADGLAASLLGRSAGAAVTLSGEMVGNPLLAAGSTIHLEGAGSSLAGSYVLTGVEHVLAPDLPYVTRFTSGPKDPSGLVDLVAPHPALVATSGVGSAASGVLLAEVTNNDDPDGLGRVKVKYAYLSDDDESAWAPVLSAAAGAARGLQCLPSVGDSVAVAFQFGDPDRPVVLGGVWNHTDAPPEKSTTSSGRTTSFLLASRKDHRVQLSDEPAGKARIGLGDAKSELVLTQDESSLTGDQKLVISAQEITIHADRKVSISAPQIEISADSTLTQSGHPIKLN